jgi:hypothetical protein
MTRTEVLEEVADIIADFAVLHGWDEQWKCEQLAEIAKKMDELLRSTMH